MFRAQRPSAAQPLTDRPWVVALAGGVLISIPLAGSATAAEHSPILIDPLDPRAEGEGPGLVGDPLLALAFVLALGLLAAAAAVLFVRLTQRR
ncbi:hypothetical protein BH24CHL6_BH24CHL6_08990 [soil metagenome]